MWLTYTWKFYDAISYIVFPFALLILVSVLTFFLFVVVYLFLLYNLTSDII